VHTVQHRRIIGPALGITAALALAATGCAGTASTGSGSGPITIGMSLPLSGANADNSKAGYQGYKLWADEVNAHGGLLGRKVKLVVLDDGFQQATAVSDYSRLIGQERVDLLLGTFSSVLNLPVAQVAERNHYLYIEPSGGADSIFSRNFKYLFFAQPATTRNLPDRLVQLIAGLPAAQRPKTAAYVSQDDPNTAEATQIFRQKLTALGVRPVYESTYSPDTSNFDAIANSIRQAAPQLVVQGALADDGVSLIRSFQKVGFNPKLLFQTNEPADPAFAPGVGAANTEGVMTAIAYSTAAPFPGNAQFVKDYTAAYHDSPTEDAANSYTAGQVLQAAVTAVGKLDQTAMADWLHGHSVPTITGPLSWDASGRPTGSLLLAQWQSGTLQIIAPASAATSKRTILDKPGWR
jgi:branched-chain amino acid transport system substrate-binding protein